MNSYLVANNIIHYFVYRETEGYWLYSSEENYKFIASSISLEDLSFTFHSHVNHWESNITERKKYANLDIFLSQENNYPYELEENSWIEMGLCGRVDSITSKHIIISLLNATLHINLKSNCFLKDIIFNDFNEREEVIAVGSELNLYEADLFLFISADQRKKEIAHYLNKIKILNELYIQSGITKIINII